MKWPGCVTRSASCTKCDIATWNGCTTRCDRVRRATEIAGDRDLVVRTSLAAPTVRVRLPDVVNQIPTPEDAGPRDGMTSDRRDAMHLAPKAVAVLGRKDAMRRARMARVPQEHRETAIVLVVPRSRKASRGAYEVDDGKTVSCPGPRPETPAMRGSRFKPSFPVCFSVPRLRLFAP